MARKKQKKVEGGGPGFLTTYADIVTLLMAFFVLLFAMSTLDPSKFMVILKGLEEGFGNTAYDDLIIEGGSAINASTQPAGSPVPVAGGTLTAQPLEAVRELSVLAAYAESVESPERPSSPESPDSFTYLNIDELLEIAKRISQAAEENGFSDIIELGFNERGLVIVISTDEVLFASGSAELNRSISEQVLQPIGQELAGFANDIFIEGHTDNAPLNMGGYDNWDLSADRALAVLDYFRYETAVEERRMVASGYGEFRPRDPRDSDEARRTNRRVELVVAFERADDLPFGFADSGETDLETQDQSSTPDPQALTPMVGPADLSGGPTPPSPSNPRSDNGDR